MAYIVGIDQQCLQYAFVLFIECTKQLNDSNILEKTYSIPFSSIDFESGLYSNHIETMELN